MLSGRCLSRTISALITPRLQKLKPSVVPIAPTYCTGVVLTPEKVCESQSQILRSSYEWFEFFQLTPFMNEARHSLKFNNSQSALVTCIDKSVWSILGTARSYVLRLSCDPGMFRRMEALWVPQEGLAGWLYVVAIIEAITLFGWSRLVVLVECERNQDRPWTLQQTNHIVKS